MKKYDVVGIGANVFDTLIRLSKFPAEDTKQKAESVTEAGGGPAARDWWQRPSWVQNVLTSAIAATILPADF